jgi:hypothetical protein
MEKLTREEHKARAMLLGMKVNFSNGYYFKSSRPSFVRIDMYTLEPIDEAEAARRNQLAVKTGKYYHD